MRSNPPLFKLKSDWLIQYIINNLQLVLPSRPPQPLQPALIFLGLDYFRRRAGRGQWENSRVAADIQEQLFNLYYFGMGVYLSQPETKKQTITGSKGNVFFCCSEMQGWRKNMQDAAIHTLDIGDGNSLFAVFDGHGGPEVSRYVSEIFVDTLKSSSLYSAKKYSQALDETFKKTDELILSPQGQQKLRSYRGDREGLSNEKISNGTGCTANVILITPDKYIVANAGDSRSSLCRAGKALDLSEDHKPQNPIESDRIAKAGGVIQMGRVNGGLNLSRSFGDFDYKQNGNLSYAQQMITCKPDIKEVARSPEDEFIIQGCDGICQGLINMIRDDLKTKKDLKPVVEDLLDHLLAKDTMEGLGCDNMTAILITLK